MSDLSDKFTSGTLKLVGSDSTGTETNFASVDSLGNLQTLNSPYEPITFSLIAEAIIIGNNKSMISITNTSSKIVKINELKIVNVQTTGVTGIVAEFRLHRIASHSVGTVLTFGKFDSTQTIDAGITARTGATIINETDLLRKCHYSTDEWGPGTSDTESTDHVMQELISLFSPKDNTKPIVINPNEGIHIRCATNSIAGSFDIYFILTQI